MALAFGVLLATAVATGAGAGPLVLPESRLNPLGQSDHWWRVQAAWGVQNVLFLGQPASPQLMVEGRAGWERFEVFTQIAGLNRNVWGGLGFRAQLADPERRRVGVVLDYLVSLPTRTSLHLGLGLTVGQDLERGGWLAGAQLGTMFSPYPNARPFGANLILDGYLGLWLRPLPFLTLNLDLTVTTYAATFIPGVVLDFAGFPLDRAPALAGLQLMVMEPINLVYAPGFASDIEGGARVDAAVELAPLLPAFVVRYGYRFR